MTTGQHAISDPAKAPPVELTSSLAPDEAHAALAQAGRRGKLPGFEALGAAGFKLDCEALPFDYELLGDITAGPEGSKISLRARRLPLMPWIFGVTLILTVWPGVWLTDSLLDVYWTKYANWGESMPWLTYAWYLPLTALPLPWVWRGLTRKSAAGAADSMTTQTEAVRKTVNP